MFARILILTIALVIVGCTAQTPADGGDSQGESASSRSGESSVSSDCPSDDTIAEIRAEYDANHLRATDTYRGVQICVTGEITGFEQDHNLILRVRARTDDGVRFAIIEVNPTWDRTYPRRGSGYAVKDATEDEMEKWENWQEYVMSASEGDTVKAECRIASLEDNGTPELDDCVKL